jgi:hypothetical protein
MKLKCGRLSKESLARIFTSSDNSLLDFAACCAGSATKNQYLASQNHHKCALTIINTYIEQHRNGETSKGISLKLHHDERETIPGYHSFSVDIYDRVIANRPFQGPNVVEPVSAQVFPIKRRA